MSFLNKFLKFFKLYNDHEWRACDCALCTCVHTHVSGQIFAAHALAIKILKNQSNLAWD